MQRICVVVTTVNVPRLLLDYAENARAHGHREEVGFIVVADLKTPPEARSIIDELTSAGFSALLFTIEAQKDWLRSYPDLAEMIPYNSDNRRNLGFLLAAERDAEIIVSLDDDNFFEAGDFFGEHAIVGTIQELAQVGAAGGWFNPCDLLQFELKRRVYARGYPYSRRWRDRPLTYGHTRGRVVLNAGLWLGDPDVDAVTRLNEPICSVSLRSGPMAVERGNLCPLSTQNTAFHRDILPCYYFILMGAQSSGLVLDRYGDVWSGFFAKKVIDVAGDLVTIGPPVTRHRRNAHNLFTDLQQELLGMALSDIMADFLESIELSSRSYSDAYVELAEGVQACLAKAPELDDGLRRYFLNTSLRMRIWVEVCARVMAG